MKAKSSKTPERKIIKEEQKSQNESVKTPDSKKKKKNNDSPSSPIDECKNIKVCMEMCRKKNYPELNKGASYEAAMRLKNKSLKKKLFDNDENADSSDENNVVSEIISKLEESPVEKKKKYRKSTPKKVKQGEPIAVTPCKSPCIKPQSANVPPESVLPDIDWEKVLGSEGNKDFYTTVMFKGKPLKVFVATEEVKIKKEKV